MLPLLRIEKGALEKHYYQEPRLLGERGLERVLEEGKRYNIAETLASGGSVIFPHTFINNCGYQIAAVVHACLDSGCDQVLVLGVIHRLTEDLKRCRVREVNGEDVSKEPLRGILGPGIERDNCWQNEYSLFMFETLWNSEVKRRGITPPRLIKRYPHLVNCSPETLPGIDELKDLAKDSLVVATSDFCHHGVAYGVPKSTAKSFGEEAIRFAHEKIKSSLELLQNGFYDEYYKSCLHPEAYSDSFDVSPVLRYLLGPKKVHIEDMKIVDTSPLFEQEPTPSWVAASLITLN